MENKEKILSCAERMFYQRGYDAVGVQEIAAAAGVTKPTLYYYFGSKRGLLDALLENKFEVLYEEIRNAQQIRGIRGKLHELARSYYRLWCREHDFYMLMMALSYAARENESYQAVHPHIQGMYRYVTQLFEDSSAELGNMNGRQEQFALSFIGIINQYLMTCSDRDVEASGNALQQEQDAEGTEGLRPSEDPGKREAQLQQLDALVNQYMHGIFS